MKMLWSAAGRDQTLEESQISWSGCSFCVATIDILQSLEPTAGSQTRVLQYFHIELNLFVSRGTTSLYVEWELLQTTGCQTYIQPVQAMASPRLAGRQRKQCLQRWSRPKNLATWHRPKVKGFFTKDCHAALFSTASKSNVIGSYRGPDWFSADFMGCGSEQIPTVVEPYKSDS